MRLTLRTLLAYLDDTLDADEVKAIGQKVADSDTAQELIAQIKQVTRRRRLTTPPEEGPGSELEPNTIAEYLDNELSEDQVARVEQVCLRSDVHLAEVAACHQILTIVLGEPILIPPTSKDRMYKLVSGKEADPSRKASAEQVQDHPPTPTRAKSEEDETLRMGVPALSKQTPTSQVLIVIGGVIAAVAILAFAIFQALSGNDSTNRVEGPSGKVPKVSPQNKTPESSKPENKENKNNQVVTPKGQAKDKNGEKTPGQTKKKTGTEPKNNETKEPGKTKKDPGTKKTPENPNPPPTKLSVPPTGKANVYIGNYVESPTGLLLQKPRKSKWGRVSAKNGKLYSEAQLVSLPGFQSHVAVASGLKLNLWGAIRGAPPHPPYLRESAVTVHKTDVPLDMTLDRGRVFINCSRKGETPIRIRFKNPTNPQTEIWEVRITGTDSKKPEAQVLVEKWAQFPEKDQFYPDKDDPLRRGPQAFFALMVLKGKASVTAFSVTGEKDEKKLSGKSGPFALQGPPGKCLLLWRSYKGTLEPITQTEIPNGAKMNPAPPQNLSPMEQMQYVKTQQAIAKAKVAFQEELKGDLAVALQSLVKKKTPPGVAPFAIQTYAAMDDIGSLVDELEKEDVATRRAAIEAAAHWIGLKKNNEYKLLDALKQDYKDDDVSLIMYLLHKKVSKFSIDEAIDPKIYQVLVEHLDHPKRVVRELVSYYLYYELQQFFPENKGIDVVTKIPYSVDMPTAQRQKSQQLWEKLLKDGKIPPTTSASSG